MIFCDEERKTWRSQPGSVVGSGFEGGNNWEMRIWGYDGMSGLLQSFGLGYFLWDLYMCSRYVGIFGWGMLAHAISAVSVFSLGFVSPQFAASPINDSEANLSLAATISLLLRPRLPPL